MFTKEPIVITSSLEDYLEFIHNKIAQEKTVKAIDLANKFNVSRPTVSEALIRLADMDLILYEGRKGIKITKKGIEQAKKTIKKHKVLLNFFTKILKVDSQLADKNACKIEHVIDDELIKKLNEYIKNHE